MQRRGQDPRHYQIAVLFALLVYGVVWLDFEISAPRAALILAGALLAQYACTRARKLAVFDPRSALISGLSLCLLLRTNSATIAILTTVFTIASKFLLRVRGKHLFNPTNFGLVCMMLGTSAVWVSPGQWGNAALFAFLMACLGGLVVNRATRADVTLAFIAIYASLIFGRSLSLGEPLTIPIHRLESGALLLFSFFMISDPKTTPDSRTGRLIFAALVAFGAFYIQFKLFRTNGLLWSLAGWSVFVPVIDWLFPAPRYEWNRTEGSLENETFDIRRNSSGARGLVESAAPGVLRLLRVQGRYEAVQPSLAGRVGARWRPYGPDDGQ